MIKAPWINVWPGEVVDIDDPDKIGRFKIRIFDIHQNLSDTDLPWIFALGAIAGRVGEDTDDNHGMFFPPKINTHCWVTLFHGDPQYPFYVGQMYGGPDGKSQVPADFLDDYPNIRGYVDPAGFKVLFNETQMRMVIEDPHGNKVIFDASGEKGEGKVSIIAEDDLQVDLKKGLDTTVGEAATILMQDDLDITIQEDAQVRVRNLDLKAENEIEVESTRDLIIRAKAGKITIDAASRDVEILGNDININAKRTLTLQSGVSTNFA